MPVLLTSRGRPDADASTDVAGAGASSLRELVRGGGGGAGPCSEDDDWSWLQSCTAVTSAVSPVISMDSFIVDAGADRSLRVLLKDSKSLRELVRGGGGGAGPSSEEEEEDLSSDLGLRPSKHANSSSREVAT